MGPEAAAARSAAILNAAYLVRHHRRPMARELRALAILALAVAVRDALNNSGEREAEALLYALAVGLHDPGDARFQV
jgi:alkylhydroperoxidase family enzyme